MQQGCFFLSLFSCNFDDQLSSNVQKVCYFLHVWIHQVRILVFDKYQQCPVPLSRRSRTNDFKTQVGGFTERQDGDQSQWNLCFFLRNAFMILRKLKPVDCTAFTFRNNYKLLNPSYVLGLRVCLFWSSTALTERVPILYY